MKSDVKFFFEKISSGVESVEIKVDDEDNVDYVHMEDPSSSEITFVRAPCPSKEVMYVRCSELGKCPSTLVILDFTLTLTLNVSDSLQSAAFNP